MDAELLVDADEDAVNALRAEERELRDLPVRPSGRSQLRHPTFGLAQRVRRRPLGAGATELVGGDRRPARGADPVELPGGVLEGVSREAFLAEPPMQPPGHETRAG